MRRLYNLLATILMCVVGASASAQIVVTFTGRDSTNQYHIPLHHVDVFNLDQLWEEVLYYPDTTLILGTVGVDDYELLTGFELKQNVPNPFDGTTEFALVLPEGRDVLLEIYDITGKLAVGKHFSSLPSGTHLFQATLTSPQTYLLSAKLDNGQMTIKMVNEGHGAGNTIRHLGMTDANGDFTLYLKDDKAASGYPFSLGDEMKYIGYAEIDDGMRKSKIILRNQSANETIPLRFEVSVPSVITKAPYSITATTAASGVQVVSNGGSAIKDSGICWSTFSNPTIDDDTISGLTSVISGLSPNTTYHVRAFATNSVGTAYGEDAPFTTLCDEVNVSITGTTTINYGQSAALFASGANSYQWSTGNTEANITVNPTTTTTYTVTGTNSYGCTATASVTVTVNFLVPSVTTEAIGNITSTTATCGGNVTSDGGSTVTERGVCWGTSPNPMANGNHLLIGNGMGSFDDIVTGLTPNTTYHVRAYAINSVGTSYGADSTFTTICDEVNVNVSGNTTINYGESANLHASGANTYHWSNSANTQNITVNPTTTTSYTVTGTNIYGCSSTTSVTVTVNPIAPTVTTNGISSITSTSANCGGTVTDNGGAAVSERGVCWGTSLNPMVSGSHLSIGNGTGSFNDIITGLTPNTTYHVRAYATNSVNTTYGEDSTFTTLCDTVNISIIGNTTINYGQSTTLTASGASSYMWNNGSSTAAITISPIVTTSYTVTGMNIHGCTATASITVTVNPIAPTVATNDINNITSTTASCGGTVTDNGGTTVLVRGICWSTSPNPTESDNSSNNNDGGVGHFSRNISGLNPNTTYHVRAYAINSVDTAYGADSVFTTLCNEVNVSIAGNTSIDYGQSTTLIASGTNNYQWDTGANTESITVSPTATTTYTVTGMNSYGCTTTASVVVTVNYLEPTVITQTVSNITSTSANCGGAVTFDGGKTVTSRGVCWGLNPNPTVSGSHLPIGNGVGSFSDIVSNLTPNTTYHVRAYAINSVGTAYGADTTFKTFCNTVNVVIEGNTIVSYGESTILTASGASSYHWSTNANNASISVCPTTTTTYTVTGTNVYGCTATANVTVTVNFLAPVVITNNDVNSVTSTSAICGGTVTSDGGASVTARGVCWSTSPNPTVSTCCTTNDGGGMGSFTSYITGLTPGITYYVRAYATNSEGTSYGEPRSFTTHTTPTVITASVVDITGSTAICGGTVTNDGGTSVTERGVCWSMSPNPTVNDSHVNYGGGMGSFNISVAGLAPGTTYHVRAYATNSVGTAYGADSVFTTLSSPTVITTTISGITATTTTCGGNVISDGGSSVTVRGVCWGTSPNPTVSDSCTTTDGGGMGGFPSNITGLTPNTTYHVRAYATNSVGTAYGADSTFTTLCNEVTISIAGNTTIDYGQNTTLTVSGANSYQWSTDATTSSITVSPMATTTYSVTGTNSYGCAATASVTVTVNFILPTVTTHNVSNITSTTATSGGDVISDGGSPVTARGVCWSTSLNPTVSGSHTTNGSGSDSFTSNLTGLTPNTTYHVRAYATNSVGTSYGADSTFTTLCNTVNVSITGTTTIDYGQSTVLTVSGASSYLWSTNATAASITVSPTSTMTYTVTGTNSYGCTATAIATVTVSSLVPIVTTHSVGNITSTNATCGGTVTSDGGSSVSVRGVCWGTSLNPTVSGSHTTNGSGTGSFTSNMTGLTPNTTYHVRAYATNSIGTAYGADSVFTTLCDTVDISITGNATIDYGQSTTLVVSGASSYYWSTNASTASITVNPTSTTTYTVTGTNNYGCTGTASVTVTVNFLQPTVTTNNVSDITSTTAACGGDVTSDGGSPVTARGVCWSTSQNPTVGGSHTTNGSGMGAFSSSLAELTPNTTYHVRAYATNSVGTAYGADNTFTTLCDVVNVTITGNTVINYGQSTTLTASGANNYQWSTNTSTSSITVTPVTTTTYTVIGTDVYGCETMSSITVIVNHLAPTVITDNVSNNTPYSATGGGNVTSNGGSPVTARGVCWSTSPYPTISDSHTTDGSGIGYFISSIVGLNPNTTYHVRAYATNSEGTSYGADSIFTTTCDVVNVTITGNATINYGQSTTLIALGANSYHWSTNANNTSITVSPTATTTYSVTGTNSYGCTATTSVTVSVNYLIPTVMTQMVGSITSTSADCGGTVTFDGGKTVTSRGICWGLNSNPKVSGSHLTIGDGVGSFNGNITGLTPNTTYHVRAYATNSVGTAYGADSTFTTLCDAVNVTITGNTTINYGQSTNLIVSGANSYQWSNDATTASITVAPTVTTSYSVTGTNSHGCTGTASVTVTVNHLAPTVTTNNVSNITSTSAICGGNVTSNGGVPVTARGVCWSTALYPTVNDCCTTTDGSGIGDFSSSITGLIPNTTYHVRAYATNSEGTSYGEDNAFTTLCNTVNVSITGTTTIDYGQSTVLTVSGASSYLWSTNATTASITVSPTSTMTYTVTGTNSYGCTATTSVTVTVSSLVPIVTTHSVDNITSTTATCGGTVTSDGGSSVSVRGVCWGTSLNPTVSGSHTTNGSGTGSFTSNMTGLTPNTTYHVRAYATNSAGTSYGADSVFTTLCNAANVAIAGTTIVNYGQSATLTASGASSYHWSTNASTASITVNPTSTTTYTVTGTNNYGCTGTASVTVTVNFLQPTVTTNNVSDITSTTAACGGDVTSDGGSPVTARGVCWSTSQNPTVGGSHTTNGSGMGAFSSSLAELTPNTTYHVRAYATNSVGTAYGADNTFTTLCDVVNVTITGNTVINYGQSTTLTASGANNYQWSTNANTASITINPTSTTTYTVTGTNSYGCTATASVTVTVNFLLPTVTTNNVSNVSSTTAICGGDVVSDGGAPVTARGVCWSTSHNPTVSDSHTNNGSGIGDYISSIIGLAPNTTYYVRAYATNSVGTTYGEEFNFITQIVFTCGTSTVTDVDDNTYNTIQIGGQCWMKENLRTTKFADGTPIDEGSSSSSTIPYRYIPDDNVSNVSIYGYLYNWAAVMHGSSSNDATPSGVQGICPDGWHLPSDAEWSQLTDYVSSQSQYWCGNNSSNIAKALASTTGWYSTTTSCDVGNDQSSNNATGFGALPAGYYTNGSAYFSSHAYFWSTTLSPVTELGYFSINYYSPAPDCEYSCDFCSYSVRCLYDDSYSQNFPTVSTNDVTNITSTTATCGGDVISTDNVAVNERGVCWSILHNPTIKDSHTIDGGGAGSFTSSITGLMSNSTYYVRAYATNSYGTVYGNEVSVTIPVNPNGDAFSCPSSPTVSDEDGNVYNTVQIGGQCWMRENLRTTKYSDGDAIPQGDIENVIATDCWYYPDEDSTNKYNYGLLYNWSAIMHGSSSSDSVPSGILGICPTGWHVPSNAEWILLADYLHSQNQYWCANDFVSNNVAKALASPVSWFTSKWHTDTCYVCNNPYNNNATRFGALPAGSTQFYNNSFGWEAYFGSSTADEGNSVHVFRIVGTSETLWLSSSSKNDGVSVRCLRDESTTDGQPCPGTPTVTDIDGNVYNTVQIGDQCWMRENLRTTKYADGTSIGEMSSSTSFTIPHIYTPCYNDSIIPIYGYLYNWSAVMHGSSSSNSNPSCVEGVCPTGWHVPSDEEWAQLTDYISNQSQYLCGNNNAYIAKALSSTTGWNSDSDTYTCAVGVNLNSNNATGFCALPAGIYYYGCGNFGLVTEFWSTSEGSASKAYSRFLSYTEAVMTRSQMEKSYGYSVRCLHDEITSAVLPTVTTDSVIAIHSISASCLGNVISTGGASVTARGMCWSTFHNPTIENAHTTDGTGTGTFMSSLTGLTAGTIYYVRAYATNREGTKYGEEVSFTTLSVPDGDAQPCPGTPTVTDIDNNTYNTVQIGGQCWMRENLRTTKYADGTIIPIGSSVSSTNPYYYDYTSSAIILEERGYLYNWPAVMHSSSSSSVNPSGVQGICPTGWHVPSDAEWMQLIDYVVGKSQYTCGSVYPYVAKALAGITYWNSSTNNCAVGNDQSANNTTGFRALPAGGYTNGYNGSGAYTIFWSTTADFYVAGGRAFNYDSPGVLSISSGFKSYGYSVRCLRDETSTVIIDEKSCPNTPTVTDHEGNVYATVQIGDQCWMRDNLRTTTSPSTGTYLIASAGSTYTGKQVCWYNNDSATYAPMNYGLLYNWNAAMDTFNTAYGETSVNTSSSNAVSVSFTGHRRGICPADWHMPSDAEWTQLTNYVKSQSEYVCGTNSNYFAKALADSVGWNAYSGTCCVGNNQSTNNATGFGALPAGYYYYPNVFNRLSEDASFWSSTEASGGSAWSRDLYYNNAAVPRISYAKNYGYPVRCLRN